MTSESLAAPKSEADRRTAAGAGYAVAAFLLWGLNPIYFKAVASVPAHEVMVHRAVWSALFLAMLVTIARQWRAVGEALLSPRTLRALLLSTALIGSNWFIYIWAVENARIVETSLGYFINPLVNVLLGLLFLRERLNVRQWVAVALATAGVLNLTVRLGELPWIALYLAISFGIYGLVRKVAPVNALGGLFIETALMTPPALAFIAWLAWTGAGAFGTRSLDFDLLLAASGVVTALPLLGFSAAAQRLRLSTLGFFQYLSPTTQFVLGVFVWGEPFTSIHAVSFACIWVALAIITVDALARARRLSLAAP